MRFRSYNKIGLREWHEWFAWRPVRVSRKETRWLEKVYRRRITGRDAYGCSKEDAAWEYMSHQAGLIKLLSSTSK